jgi:transcriptional regulator with XRE-family HTH domain
MLGDTVHQARCAKVWSIQQLSKRSGVPERLIRELEGRSVTYVPSEANTVLLAEALKVPAGPLLEQRERLFEQWHRRDGKFWERTHLVGVVLTQAHSR